MRILPFLLLAAGPARAHTGHFGELAGHDHILFGAGLGAIAAAAILGWLKGRKTDNAADETHEEEPEADGERTA